MATFMRSAAPAGAKPAGKMQIFGDIFAADRFIGALMHPSGVSQSWRPTSSVGCKTPFDANFATLLRVHECTCGSVGGENVAEYLHFAGWFGARRFRACHKGRHGGGHHGHHQCVKPQLTNNLHRPSLKLAINTSTAVLSCTS